MAIGINNTTPTQRGFSLGRVVEWRWGLLTLWLTGTAIFLARALAGFFTHPLTSLSLSSVGLVSVIVAMELRSLLRGNYQASSTLPQSPNAWLAQLLPSSGVLLLAMGFSVAGAHLTGLVVFWTLVAAEILFGAARPWTLPLLRQLMRRDHTAYGKKVLEHPQKTVEPEPPPKPLALVHASLERAMPANLVTADLEAAGTEPDFDAEFPWLWHEATALQELRHMTLPDSGLCVTGSQRHTLLATQQIAVVHTVFHPPFDAVPTVTIEMQEPEDVTIKAAQILPHGIRWELRVVSPLEEAQQVQWAYIAATPQVPK
jgi:hypothetical protein